MEPALNPSSGNPLNQTTGPQLNLEPGAFIFFGSPGCGKGTQSRAFARLSGLPVISSSALLEQIEAQQDEVGAKVRDLKSHGFLVPDEIMVPAIMARLAQPDCVRGFILDGFPRSVAQAEILDRILAEKGLPLLGA